MSDPNPPTKREQRWLSVWLRPFAQGAPASRPDPALKLPRIADILARTGREPPSSK